MASLGEVAPAAALPTWMQALPSIANAVVQARTTDKVNRINLDREARGLKPLNAESYQPGVKVGIDPQTRQLIFAGIAVAVLGAVLVASIRTRKSGRG
ncbi:MAG: hypothetical protein K0S46_2207 [Moraxellaceae bacterium]|jgi:hypothetical protein|nr:hypothetical protein [Moraxellaceae bacterium]